MSLKSHTDQSLDLTSEQFTVFNYGSIVYSKTPVVLDYLMSYLGKEKFDKAIKYYNNLKKYQKIYSESEEVKIKLRAANKRYYEKKKQDPEWVKKIAKEKLEMYYDKKIKIKNNIIEISN